MLFCVFDDNYDDTNIKDESGYTCMREKKGINSWGLVHKTADCRFLWNESTFLIFLEKPRRLSESREAARLKLPPSSLEEAIVLSMLGMGGGGGGMPDDKQSFDLECIADVGVGGMLEDEQKEVVPSADELSCITGGTKLL